MGRLTSCFPTDKLHAGLLLAARPCLQAVAAEVGNDRTAQQVLQRCTRRGLVTGIRKGVWSSDEDGQLLQARAAPQPTTPHVSWPKCAMFIKLNERLSCGNAGCYRVRREVEQGGAARAHAHGRAVPRALQERAGPEADVGALDSRSGFRRAFSMLSSEPALTTIIATPLRQRTGVLQRRTGASGRSWRSARAARAAAWRGPKWQPR